MCIRDRDKAYLTEAVAGMDKPIEELTDEDKYLWQYRHKQKDRQRTRKELDNKAWLSVDPTLTGAKERFYVHELIEETRELFMELTKEENIIWLEIFKESKQWKGIKKNRHKINKILDSKGWLFKVKDEVNLDPIHFLDNVLKEFNYYTQVRAGITQTRKDLQAKAKKDNLTAFNKWKKLQDRTHLRLHHYLFESLAEGQIKINDLSHTTKKYLLAFDHIVVEEIVHV